MSGSCLLLPDGRLGSVCIMERVQHGVQGDLFFLQLGRGTPSFLPDAQTLTLPLPPCCIYYFR